MAAVQETIEQVKKLDVDQYKYGFETEIESIKAPKGLDEDTVRFISAKKDEPEWMLEWRLDAFERWQAMTEPTWAKVHYPKIDFQDLYYYSAPKSTEGPKSLDEIDPELLEDLRQARHSAEGAGDPGRRPKAGPEERSRRGRAAANTPPARSRSTRCSTACRSSPRSRRSWPRPA